MMTLEEFAQEIDRIESDAKSMNYNRRMFRFAFERGVALGLNHDPDTLTDDSLNDAIQAWNENEADNE